MEYPRFSISRAGSARPDTQSTIQPVTDLPGACMPNGYRPVMTPTPHGHQRNNVEITEYLVLNKGHPKTAYMDNKGSRPYTAYTDTRQPQVNILKNLDSGTKHLIALQLVSLQKENGGSTFDKGGLPPARTTGLVSVDNYNQSYNRRQKNHYQKHGGPKRQTRSLPNSSINEVEADPYPRNASSAPGQKKQWDQGTRKHRPPPKLNTYVTGQYVSEQPGRGTGVVQSKEHSPPRPAPAGIPSNKSAVKASTDPGEVPTWLKSDTKPQAQDKVKDDPSSKPWLQSDKKSTVPSQTALSQTDTSQTAPSQPPGSEQDIFHAPQKRSQSPVLPAEEIDTGKRAKILQTKYEQTKERLAREKEAARKQREQKEQERQRRIRQEEERRKKEEERKEREHKEKEQAKIREEEERKKRLHQATVVLPHKEKTGVDQKAKTQIKLASDKTKELDEDQTETFTLNDAVNVYTKEYTNVKTKANLNQSRTGKTPRGHSAKFSTIKNPYLDPKSRVPPWHRKEYILSRRETKKYKEINKVYSSEKIKKTRQNQFYKKVLELQLEQWRKDHAEFQEKQLHKLEAQYKQQQQLKNVRDKFEEEQVERFHSQYVTSRVLEHEWSTRFEYGLPEDIGDEPEQQVKIKPKSVKPPEVFSFKNKYEKNKKRFAAIFKHSDPLVGQHGFKKPPLMEGIDTIELTDPQDPDKSRRRSVKAIVSAAQRYLNSTEDADSDISTSEGEYTDASDDSEDEAPQKPQPRRPVHPVSQRTKILPSKGPANPPTKVSFKPPVNRVTQKVATKPSQTQSMGASKSGPKRPAAVYTKSLLSDWRASGVNDNKQNNGKDKDTKENSNGTLPVHGTTRPANGSQVEGPGSTQGSGSTENKHTPVPDDKDSVHSQHDRLDSPPDIDGAPNQTKRSDSVADETPAEHTSEVPQRLAEPIPHASEKQTENREHPISVSPTNNKEVNNDRDSGQTNSVNQKPSSENKSPDIDNKHGKLDHPVNTASSEPSSVTMPAPPANNTRHSAEEQQPQQDQGSKTVESDGLPDSKAGERHGKDAPTVPAADDDNHGGGKASVLGSHKGSPDPVPVGHQIESDGGGRPTDSASVKTPKATQPKSDPIPAQSHTKGPDDDQIQHRDSNVQNKDKSLAKPIANNATPKQSDAKPIVNNATPKQPEAKPIANNSTPRQPEAKPIPNNSTQRQPEAKPIPNNSTQRQPETQKALNKRQPERKLTEKQPAYEPPKKRPIVREDNVPPETKKASSEKAKPVTKPQPKQQAGAVRQTPAQREQTKPQLSKTNKTESQAPPSNKVKVKPKEPPATGNINDMYAPAKKKDNTKPKGSGKKKDKDHKRTRTVAADPNKENRRRSVPLEDQGRPDIPDTELQVSDDADSDSDEDIFERAMRKYGIVVDSD